MIYYYFLGIRYINLSTAMTQASKPIPQANTRMQSYLTVIVIGLYNIGDAYCDARFPYWRPPIKAKSWTREQWTWHAMKWATTYPIQLWLVYLTGFNLLQIAITALVMLIVWRAVYALSKP